MLEHPPIIQKLVDSYCLVYLLLLSILYLTKSIKIKIHHFFVEL